MNEFDEINNLFNNPYDDDMYALYDLDKNDQKEIENFVFPASLTPSDLGLAAAGLPEDNLLKTDNICESKIIEEPQKPKIKVMSLEETQDYFKEQSKQTKIIKFQNEFKANHFRKNVPEGLIYNEVTQKFEKLPDLQVYDKEIELMMKDPFEKKDFYAKPVDKKMAEMMMKNPEKSKEIITSKIKKVDPREAMKDFNKDLVNEILNGSHKNKERSRDHSMIRTATNSRDISQDRKPKDKEILNRENRSRSKTPMRDLSLASPKKTHSGIKTYDKDEKKKERSKSRGKSRDRESNSDREKSRHRDKSSNRHRESRDTSSDRHRESRDKSCYQSRDKSVPRTFNFDKRQVNVSRSRSPCFTNNYPSNNRHSNYQAQAPRGGYNQHHNPQKNNTNNYQNNANDYRQYSNRNCNNYPTQNTQNIRSSHINLITPERSAYSARSRIDLTGEDEPVYFNAEPDHNRKKIKEEMQDLVVNLKDNINYIMANNTEDKSVNRYDETSNKLLTSLKSIANDISISSLIKCKEYVRTKMTINPDTVLKEYIAFRDKSLNSPNDMLILTSFYYMWLYENNVRSCSTKETDRRDEKQSNFKDMSQSYLKPQYPVSSKVGEVLFGDISNTKMEEKQRSPLPRKEREVSNTKEVITEIKTSQKKERERERSKTPCRTVAGVKPLPPIIIEKEKTNIVSKPTATTTTATTTTTTTTKKSKSPVKEPEENFLKKKKKSKSPVKEPEENFLKHKRKKEEEVEEPKTDQKKTKRKTEVSPVPSSKNKRAEKVEEMIQNDSTYNLVMKLAHRITNKDNFENLKKLIPAESASLIEQAFNNKINEHISVDLYDTPHYKIYVNINSKENKYSVCKKIKEI